MRCGFAAAIVPIVALIALSPVSCSLRDVDFLSSGGAAPTDAATETETGHPCPILTGGDVCSAIPKLTAKAQVLDGVGDEFCDVKATKFVVANGVETDPTPPPPGIDTVAWIRAAWSAEGLH